MSNGARRVRLGAPITRDMSPDSMADSTVRQGAPYAHPTLRFMSAIAFPLPVQPGGWPKAG